MSEPGDRLERRADELVRVTRELLANLVSMRIEHGLLQQDVADRMGVSQPTVSAFERYDSNPTLATIRRYAMAVDAQLSIEVVDDCAEAVPAEWIRSRNAGAWISSSDADAEWTVIARSAEMKSADV